MSYSQATGPITIKKTRYSGIDFLPKATYVYREKNLIISAGWFAKSDCSNKAALAEGAIIFTNLRTLKTLCVSKLHDNPIKCLLVETGRNLMITACRSIIKFNQFRGRTFKLIKQIKYPNSITSLFFVELRNLLIVFDDSSGVVHMVRLGIWDVEVLFKNKSDDPFYRADYSKTYDVLACASYRYMVLFKLDKAQKPIKIAKFDFESIVWTINFVPVGRSEFLFAAGSQNKVYYMFVGSNLSGLPDSMNIFNEHDVKQVSSMNTTSKGIYQLGCISRYDNCVYMVNSSGVARINIKTDGTKLEMNEPEVINISSKQSTKELVCLSNNLRVYIYPLLGRINLLLL